MTKLLSRYDLLMLALTITEVLKRTPKARYLDWVIQLYGVPIRPILLVPI
jgi:hypothetical protein